MLSQTFLSAAVLAISTHVQATTFPDPNAPKIEGLVYGPKVVPTGSVFTVSLTASDPQGVDHVTFSAYPNEGWWIPCSDAKLFTLVNGTALEGTWEAECPIPAGTPSQTYAFNYNCVDSEGHSTFKTFKDGFDVSGGPVAEYDAPVIEKISCAEVVEAGTMLDVFLTIADASGVDTVTSYVKVHETDGSFVPCSSEQFVQESGSPTEGVFRASCLVPADTPNGDYYLEVHVYDTQKNPAQQTVESAFEVVGGAAPDHIAPSITDITYSDSTVEIGQTMSLTASISDLQSGVDYVNFQAREPYTQELLCDGPMHLQSGDMTAGIWDFSCDVPAGSIIGYYTGAVYAFDNQNNEAMMTSSFSVIMPTEA
jgi:hypothetical protein